MQYADIIVDHKAGYAPLTYAIPPQFLAHLKVGSIVTVPIGKLQAAGVVQRFIKRLDSSIATKLKPIKSIVYSDSFVPGYLIESGRRLHEAYGFGLNDILFSLLPPIPKRLQPSVEALENKGPGFQVFEYSLSVASRIKVYDKLIKRNLRQKKSVIIVCSTHSGVQNVSNKLKELNIRVIPEANSPKDQREYFIRALTNKEPLVYIGSRGILKTPLNNVGTVIVDEPWFPGQKEERAPRFWTPLVAERLCLHKQIPLYLFTSIPWPESKLLAGLKRYVVKSVYGSVYLAPRRNLKESLVQFLSEYDETHANLAIFLRPSNQTIYWCQHCKQSSVVHGKCGICGRNPIVLPQLVKETVNLALKECAFKGAITLFSSDELLCYQQFDASLILGFDVFLSVVDFRSSSYLVSLLYIIGAQAKKSLLVTTHPDEWTSLMKKNHRHFMGEELSLRRQHYLPPYATLVQLTAANREDLVTITSPKTSDILHKGEIHRHNDNYRLMLHLKLHAALPQEWYRKSNIKVDILPNYIEGSSQK